MLGKGALKPPLVRLQLVRRGPELVGVHAEVRWPKHGRGCADGGSRLIGACTAPRTGG